MFLARLTYDSFPIKIAYMYQKYLYILITFLAVITTLTVIAIVKNEFNSMPISTTPAHNINSIIETNMKIDSMVFKNNEFIPSKFTCDGINTNPLLRFSDVPTEAKSLALIMDDPDAPAGTWVHWVLWNIDPKTEKIEEDSAPVGAKQGMTSYNETKYGGPCPPNGTHHYYFKLYALDEKLELASSTTASDLENAMQGHVIAQTEMIGLYSR